MSTPQAKNQSVVSLVLGQIPAEANALFKVLQPTGEDSEIQIMACRYALLGEFDSKGNTEAQLHQLATSPQITTDKGAWRYVLGLVPQGNRFVARLILSENGAIAFENQRSQPLQIGTVKKLIAALPFMDPSRQEFIIFRGESEGERHDRRNAFALYDRIVKENEIPATV